MPNPFNRPENATDRTASKVKRVDKRQSVNNKDLNYGTPSGLTDKKDLPMKETSGVKFTPLTEIIPDK